MVDVMVKEETIVEELGYICNVYGGLLRPTDVVLWADEHPNSSLHNLFEWNDERAGDLYRYWQARKLIASVKVTMEVNENKKCVRAYVSLCEDRLLGGGYRLLVDVLNDANTRRALLSQALAEMNRVLRKYRQLEELAGLQSEIDKLEAL